MALSLDGEIQLAFDRAMQGKICMVTGASSGIGYVTALELARMGGRVVAVCRDPERGAAAVADIVHKSGNSDVTLLLADLSSQAAIRKLAAEFQERFPALHVLVNNAGLIVGERQVTQDGLEYTFALNHLAYFLVTDLLLDMLKASAPSRIVNVASHLAAYGVLNFDDLQGEQSYGPWVAYAQSKLANVFFTFELARRLEGTGVTANCLHPGAVGSNFGASGTPLLRFLTKLAKPFLTSNERGAETSVYLASSPEVEGVTGKYFARMKPRRTSRQWDDPDVAKKLWDASEALIQAPA
jgi:NAD(P)-dependent dehydrogenase (short-subunit alcohol dehydrogenase family)